MVPLDDKTSNELFEVFDDWEHLLRGSNFSAVEEIYNSNDDEKAASNPVNNYEEPQP